jgi:hypothetical protein
MFAWRRRSDGNYECVPVPKRQCSRARAMVPLLKKIKASGRSFLQRLSLKKQAWILRGSKGYVEPQVDYCSTASQFKTVWKGLVARPTWKRLNFDGLLSLQYGYYSPKARHRAADYAFQPDGTPTPNYAEPLAIYARSHPEQVAKHKAKRLRIQERRRKQRLGPSAKTGLKTSNTILPPSRQHPLSIGSRANVVVQRQVVASIEVDDEDISDTEDERQPRNRVREWSEDSIDDPWAGMKDEYELRGLRKQRKGDVICRQGPSPEPRRMAERL